MSTTHLDFGPPEATDIDGMNAVLQQALHNEGMANWTAALGHERMRVVRRGDRVVAGLGVIPMGHFFGGANVPAAGVTAFGVVPDQRGSGVGLWMLQQMLNEQRAKGIPLATLYPATTAFYRRSGFERAAQRIIYELPTAAIGVRDYTLAAEPIEADRYDQLKAVYTRRAAQSAAWIDRPDFYWQRVLEPKDRITHTFGVFRAGVAEGYVSFFQSPWNEPLIVRDLVALTADAGRRLLTLLADHRSMVQTVRFPGGPNDPLLFLMPEQKQTVYSSLDLMLRILDVPAALTARRYTPGFRGEFHLAITDELFVDNTGHFVLQIADGHGHAERGGNGSIQLHIRDLAALYSGYYTPLELVQASNIITDETSLALATLAFSGPRPWLPDMF